MERLKVIGTVIGYCVLCAMFVLLAWLYLIVTPDQLSGEADLSVQACEDAGVEYAPAFGKGVR